MNLRIPFLGLANAFDVPALGLLSRVMGVASRSRTAFHPAGVSLEHVGALPVRSQHHHPLAYSVLAIHRGSSANLVVTCLDEQFLSLRMLSSWVTWVCTVAVTGHEFALYRLKTMRLSRGVSDVLTHMNCFLAVNEFLLFGSTGQSCGQQFKDPLLESRPRIRLSGIVRWASWMLGFSADRRVHKLVLISEQSFDNAGGVHVGKDESRRQCWRPRRHARVRER